MSWIVILSSQPPVLFLSRTDKNVGSLRPDDAMVFDTRDNALDGLEAARVTEAFGRKLHAEQLKSLRARSILTQEKKQEFAAVIERGERGVCLEFPDAQVIEDIYPRTGAAWKGSRSLPMPLTQKRHTQASHDPIGPLLLPQFL